VRANKQRLVIKPANEGRGFRVFVGPFSTDEEWAEACRPDPDMPAIVQEYTPTLSLPVACERDGVVQPRPMFLTLGLTMIDSQFAGLISRVSANSVTNVAREGFLQGAYRV